MSTGTQTEDAVWVEEYTTATGRHVAGHWRRKGAGGPPAGDTTDGDAAPPATAAAAPPAPSGSVGVPQPPAGAAAQRPRSEAGAAGEDRVAAGLAALKRRRAALAQDTATADGSDNKCGSCGQFAAAAGHTCTGTSDAPYSAGDLAQCRRTIDTQHRKVFDHSSTLAPTIVGSDAAKNGGVEISHTRIKVDPYADPPSEPPGYITITPPGPDRYRNEQHYTWPRDPRTDPTAFGPDTAHQFDTYEEAAEAAADAAAAARHGQRRCSSCGRYVPAQGDHTCPPAPSEEEIAAAEKNALAGLQPRVGGGFSTGGTAVEAEELGLVEAVRVGRSEQHDDHYVLTDRGRELMEQNPGSEDQADGAGRGAANCPHCGQYMGADHTCPTPEGLPEGDYSGMKRDERTKAMLEDLEASVASVMESGQLTRWLDSMSSNGLQRWSANNRMLAVLQMYQRGTPPEELSRLHLMGFRQWEKHNRKVSKGAKAVWILAPVTKKIRDEDDDGNERETTRVVGFKGVPVFDVSDTSGEPLPEPPIKPPEGEATPGTIEGLRDRVRDAGYSYEETEIPGCRPDSGEGTLGYTEPSTKRIVVDSRLSSAQKASTVAHELGHVHCGHVDGDYADYKRHRGRMETEAEMTAYLVNRSRGMGTREADSFSPGYIATWSKGDPKVMHAAMDKATRAYNKIMDGDWPDPTR